MKASRLAATAVLLLSIAAVTVAGRGGSADSTPTATTAGSAAYIAAGTDFARMRDKVVTGFAEDFRGGTGAGPHGFGRCLRIGVRRALTAQQLDRLVAVYRRPEGKAFAAQALSVLAAPIGGECGGAKYLPEPIVAAEALGGRYPLSRLDVAARRLGLVYGPFLGVTCRPPRANLCDDVGVDVVLRHPAAAVTVMVAGRGLRLRTPGLHTGERGRDWVGYLHNVGLGRPGSAFGPPDGRDPDSWHGYPPVYVPVRLDVAHRNGRRVTGTLPRVFLSPGWG